MKRFLASLLTLAALAGIQAACADVVYPGEPFGPSTDWTMIAIIGALVVAVVVVCALLVRRHRKNK